MSAIKNPPAISSDALKHLRPLLKSFPEWQKIIGPVAQFRVVVDSNIVLRDLVWLAKARRNPTAKTGLQEVLAAETLDVYAPPKLIEEVERHLLRRAEEEAIEITTLQETWAEYRTQLKFIKPKHNLVKKHQKRGDPDDAPFIALAEQLRTDGILSADSHISQMGGNQLTFDFILSARDYSRSAAVYISIECMGMVLGMLTLGMMQAFVAGVKKCIDAIARMPDWLKVTLTVGVLVALLHPKSRAVIIEGVRKATASAQVISSEIISGIFSAAMLSGDHKVRAGEHLVATKNKIRNPTPRLQRA